MHIANLSNLNVLAVSGIKLCCYFCTAVYDSVLAAFCSVSWFFQKSSKFAVRLLTKHITWYYSEVWWLYFFCFFKANYFVPTEQWLSSSGWVLWGWLSISVTSAALHLVLIACELITPVSVTQCCQISPAQPCCHSILCTPTGQMEAWEVLVLHWKNTVTHIHL